LPVAAVLLSACAPAQPQPTLPAGAETEAWQSRRSELRRLQDAFNASKPYSLNVTLELWVERLGMRTRGRGAVAVHPDGGVRMIMLGPGGTTAMDLWICRDAFRFSVPAADLVRRGDAHTPPDELRGLPVSFLRWWFLRPLRGKLLAAFDRDGAHHYVLKDDDSAVHLLDKGDELSVRRLSHGDEERIETTPELCGHVHYNQSSTSIDLDVHCEQVNENTPPLRAFVDPDDPERACIQASEEDS
jgi:hypothetical protein